MGWFQDTNRNEEYSQVDLELEAAGYTATPRGEAIAMIGILLWVSIIVGMVWWLV